jgi:hypothetical protein
MSGPSVSRFMKSPINASLSRQRVNLNRSRR